SIETLEEDQNDRLGRDVASMDGHTIFQGVPLTYVPQLDSETNAPVYMIDWSTFKIKFLKGEYMREDPPAKAAGAHNVVQSFVNMTWNTQCTNRRKQTVLTTGA